MFIFDFEGFSVRPSYLSRAEPQIFTKMRVLSKEQSTPTFTPNKPGITCAHSTLRGFHMLLIEWAVYLSVDQFMTERTRVIHTLLTRVEQYNTETQL